MMNIFMLLVHIIYIGKKKFNCSGSGRYPKEGDMEKIAIIVMTAFLVAVEMPAMAQHVEKKEVCRIPANSCLNKAELIQKRLKKLNAELAKGSTRYSAEYLKMLEQKLQEAMTQLDKIEGKK